jgi:hypothetical protein
LFAYKINSRGSAEKVSKLWREKNLKSFDNFFLFCSKKRYFYLNINLVDQSVNMSSIRNPSFHPGMSQKWNKRKKAPTPALGQDLVQEPE